jgi:hypothetical protein
MLFSNWCTGMKIYDRNLAGTSGAEAGKTQESQNLSRAGTGTSAARGGADRSTDRVEFSGTLGQLSRALGTFESNRATRVQALAVEYQSGSYRADSAATSRGLITEAMSTGLQ